MIVAQFFSALGALCLAYSSFAKNRENMLIWQIIDYLLTAIANILLGGYTGAMTIMVSVIRNTLIIKKQDTPLRILLLVLIQIGAGIYLNQLGWIGFLPIISSLSYTLATFLTAKVEWLRWVIIENMLLWLIYDITIKAFPASVMDIFIIVTTLIAINKHHKTGSSL
ncbi:YgjV family protein [Streptococcus dentiloxodontae]